MRKLFIFCFILLTIGLRAQYPAFMPEFKVLNTKVEIKQHNAVNGAVVLLRGIDSINDGNGALFQFDNTSIEPANDSTIFAVTGVAVGRWLKMSIYGGSIINVEGDTTIVVNNIRVKNILKVPLTDTTHAKKGCANIIYDTILEHFYGDVCLNGVHSSWGCFDCTSGTGTVTSVATNDATGIKGGTITTTGTLFIDTAIISTKANVDSKTVTLTQGSNISITGNPTQNLGQNPSWTINATGFGTGTVTSVGLSAPTIFTVSGSPVTTSGTLTFAPNNATGDLIYGSGTNTLAYRAIGTTGQHLVVVGGVPVWRDTTAVPTSSNFVSSWSAGTTGMTPNSATTGIVTMAGTLNETHGGTNQTSYLTGDILYASGANTLSKLAIGTAKQTLHVVGGIPSWQDTTAAGSGAVTTWSAGTTGFTPNTATTGAVTLGGTANIAAGGTNNGALSVTNQNLIIADGTKLIGLAKGSNGQHLIVNGSGNLAWGDTTAVPTSFPYWALANGGTLSGDNTISMASHFVKFSGGRTELGMGAAVTAANDLILGGDGNTFSITGATQINAITVTNWQAGSVINLIFASTPTVKHNTAGGAGTAVILLAGAQDYTVSINDVLSLLYDGTSWHEISRKVAGTSTGGAYWQLVNGGTMTGVNTLTQNRANGFLWNGIYRATATNQYYAQIAPTDTGRATASDNMIGLDLSPTFIAGASTQTAAALNINPTFTAGVGSISGIAIKHKGDIVPSVGDTYGLGTSALQYNNVFGTKGRFNNIGPLSANDITFQTSGSSTVAKLYVAGAQMAGLAIASGGNVPATNNGYGLEVKAESKLWAGAVISALSAPGKPTVAVVGSAGTTHIVYGIVCRLTNGATTAVSVLDSVTTANATLTGPNHVNITANATETVGAAFYDVYVIRSDNVAVTIGKIGTYNAQAFYSPTAISHSSNTQGDGVVAPVLNTTANFGVGTTTPTSQSQLLGSFALQYVAKTASYTATALDQTIDFTSGTDTLTLPTAIGIQGRRYTIVNSGSGTCKINTTSSQTFVNINTAPTILTLNPVGATAITSYTVMSNNANWIVVAKVKDE